MTSWAGVWAMERSHQWRVTRGDLGGTSGVCRQCGADRLTQAAYCSGYDSASLSGEDVDPGVPQPVVPAAASGGAVVAGRAGVSRPQPDPSRSADQVANDHGPTVEALGDDEVSSRSDEGVPAPGDRTVGDASDTGGVSGAAGPAGGHPLPLAGPVQGAVGPGEAGTAAGPVRDLDPPDRPSPYRLAAGRSLRAGDHR